MLTRADAQPTRFSKENHKLEACVHSEVFEDVQSIFKILQHFCCTVLVCTIVHKLVPIYQFSVAFNSGLCCTPQSEQWTRHSAQWKLPSIYYRQKFFHKHVQHSVCIARRCKSISLAACADKKENGIKNL